MTFCEDGNDDQSGKSVSHGGSGSCSLKRGSYNQMKGQSYGYHKRMSNDSLNESESGSVMMNCLKSLSQRLQQHQMYLKSE